MTASYSGTFRIEGERPVVRLGFGAMRITGPGIWGPPRDHDQPIRVLRRAVALGVTTDSYGPYVSEELFHEALQFSVGLRLSSLLSRDSSCGL